MSDTPLIDALSPLYDEYNRKARAATKLTGMLKGKASALGKIRQAFGEYAALADSDEVRTLQQTFSVAQDSAVPFATNGTRDAKAFTALASALKTVINTLSAAPLDVVKLGGQVDMLKKQADSVRDERLNALLSELTAVVEHGQQELAYDFGNTFRDALAAQDIALTGTAPHFEIGRFEITVNFLTKSAVILYGKEVVVPRVALSPERIIKAYQAAYKSIAGRNEDPAQWMEQFYNAWVTVQHKQVDTPNNKRLNVIACYYELVMLRQSKAFLTAPSKTRFSEYSRAQFAYDLFENAIRPQRSHNGLVVFAHVGVRAQTDTSARSLWVVEGRGPNDGRYIGDIVFDKNE